MKSVAWAATVIMGVTIPALAGAETPARQPAPAMSRPSLTAVKQHYADTHSGVLPGPIAKQQHALNNREFSERISILPTMYVAKGGKGITLDPKSASPTALKQHYMDTHGGVLPGPIAKQQHFIDKNRLFGPPVILRQTSR